MARRYAQIDRLLHHSGRHRLDHDGLGIHERRWRIGADVYAAEEARLTDRDRNADIRSERRCRGYGNCGCNQKSFHVESPWLEAGSQRGSREIIGTRLASQVLSAPGYFFRARGWAAS